MLLDCLVFPLVLADKGYFNNSATLGFTVGLKMWCCDSMASHLLITGRMVWSTALPLSTQPCDRGGGWRNQRPTEPPEFGCESFQTDPHDSADAGTVFTEAHQAHKQQNCEVQGVLNLPLAKREVTGVDGTLGVSWSAHVSAPQCCQRLKIFTRFNNPSAYFGDERSGRYKGGKQAPPPHPHPRAVGGEGG